MRQRTKINKTLLVKFTIINYDNIDFMKKFSV